MLYEGHLVAVVDSSRVTICKRTNRKVNEQSKRTNKVTKNVNAFNFGYLFVIRNGTMIGFDI